MFLKAVPSWSFRFFGEGGELAAFVDVAAVAALGATFLVGALARVLRVVDAFLGACGVVFSAIVTPLPNESTMITPLALHDPQFTIPRNYNIVVKLEI